MILPAINLRAPILIGLLFGVGLLRSQISPGDLTSAHANYEGVSNCTKCHELGDKVSNTKCLDCHKELKSRVDRGKGYHASSSVRGKDCFSCHSEHHGRAFEIVRFDKKTFDHKQTGYTLTGKHLQADCAACHKSEYIAAVDARSLKKTYLGLSAECKSCHKDVHQGTLSSTDCASCHTTEKFDPAAKFDHARTKFPLRGLHGPVACVKCHQETTRNGEKFQVFAGVDFVSCASCHEDPHKQRLGNDCKACHQEEGFDRFAGRSGFNHNKTGYPLQGQHKRVDCASCHQEMNTSGAQSVFREFAGKDVDQCATCHKDVHEGRFGANCQQCHTVDSFRKLQHADQFDHQLTGWPLEGKHAPVDCASCHKGRLTDPVPHERCTDCHQDYHRGELVTDGKPTDCAACHSVRGFAGSNYTVEQHNAGPFPLAGAHLATPCFACHKPDDQWSFRNIGSRCQDCHEDIHAGELETGYYPGKDCATCHNTDQWAAVTFDHGRTEFALTGRHIQARCSSCHVAEDRGTTQTPVKFKDLPTTCNACHQDVHGGQFSDATGRSDCARCHEPARWNPSAFDHNTARFVLEGKHQGLDCSKCHQPDPAVDPAIVRYKTGKLACVDCHQ